MKTRKVAVNTLLLGALLSAYVSSTAFAAVTISATTSTKTISGKSVSVYTLSSDGTPYYGTSGVAGFPSNTYANTPAAQSYTFYIPASPTLSGTSASPVYTPGGMANDIGVAADGVPFDPLTSFCLSSSAPSTSNACAYRLEALLQSPPTTSSSPYTGNRVSIDQHNAHTQPGGLYHYHSIPCGILTTAGGSALASCNPSATSGAWTQLPSKATVVGYARDGYPIVVKSGVYSSYSAVTTAGSGRPAASANGLDSTNAYGNWSADLTTLLSAGSTTFTQAKLPTTKTLGDFTYTGPSTLGTSTSKLGLCNEAPNSDSTIQTLNGKTAAYVYYLTPNFPMVPRCLIGVTDAATTNVQGFLHVGSGY